MMSEEDKEDFKRAKPYIVGLVALVVGCVSTGRNIPQNFDTAEEFVKEFERRNQIEK